MKGSYVIFLELESDSKLDIGRLGRVHFRKGIYAYAGSAMGSGKSLEKRTERHERLASAKKGRLRWHIDYFTTAPGVRVSGVIRVVGKNMECRLAAMLERLGGRAAAEKFGSSDCGCRSHLFLISEMQLSGFINALQSL